jgi:hypothetical protein
MNKMADSLYYSTRDFRDIILAELAKLEYGLREHTVNAAAVAQVRSVSASAPSSASGPAQDSAKLLAEANARIDELDVYVSELEGRNVKLEDASSAASIAHQAEVKKLRKENMELQGLMKQNKQVDELESQLEAAQRQIRALTQENIGLKNTLDLNDKYAAQDKQAYTELKQKYAALENTYNESLKVVAKPVDAPKAEEPKKEVKKVVKPEPEPEPEEEQEEEEAEEGEDGEDGEDGEEQQEEEGEEPVEFEYKGKTYYLSSDNEVYEEQEDGLVQVGTWNGKKILFQ